MKDCIAINKYLRRHFTNGRFNWAKRRQNGQSYLTNIVCLPVLKIGSLRLPTALHILFVLALSAMPLRAISADAQLYYDQLGRLIEVVDTSGNTAQYTYDAAGNISGIKNVIGSTLSVGQFVPISGAIGSTVTIYGSGFSTTPANNTVKFNGTTTTVSAATSTKLTVTVPSGATTGTVSVQTTSGTVTSAVSFTVAASLVPTIASFSPGDASIGSTVTITGTNFQTADVQNNKVTIGERGVGVNSVTGTSIQITGGTSSGRISVATPYGKATSSTDYYVLPGALTHANTEVRSRIIPGGSPITVTTTVNGNKAAVIFDADIGKFYSLLVTSNTFQLPLGFDLYAPDGFDLGWFTYNQAAFSFSKMPSTGTYTLTFDPLAVDKGTMQLKLFSNPIVPANMNGTTAVSVATGGTTYLSFPAKTFTGYSVALSSLTFTPSAAPGTAWVNVVLTDIAGNAFSSCTLIDGETCFFPPTSFPVGGNYHFWFIPSDAVGTTYASIFNATIAEDVAGAITVDAGSATTATTTIPARGAQYTFLGSAGQNLTAIVTNNSIDISGTPTDTNITIYPPITDPTIWSPTISVGTGLDAVIPLSLPDTGIYTLVMSPNGAAFGSIDLQVKSLATGSLTINGTTSISLSNGRSGSYSFSASANTGYTFTSKNLSFSPSGAPGMYLQLFDTSSTSLAICNANATDNCHLPPSLFTTSGTYTLQMAAGLPFPTIGAYASSLDAVFSTDVTGSLTVNAGSTTAVTTTKEGQVARYDFSGTAGQYISLVLTNSSLDDSNPGSGSRISFYVLAPDTSMIAATTLDKNGVGTLDLENLPQTGTYTIVMSPQGLIKGAVSMQLKTYATASFAVNSSHSIPLTAGQKGGYTFSGVASTYYYVATNSLVLTPTATTPSLSIRLLDPSKNQIYSCSIDNTTNCYLDPSTIYTSGTYTILVDPVDLSGGTGVYSIIGNLVLTH